MGLKPQETTISGFGTFRIHPGYPNLLVAKDGRIFERETLEDYDPQRPLIATIDDQNHTTYISQSRLVAETWLNDVIHQGLALPGKTHFVIRHKNRDVHDNRVENLELEFHGPDY